MTINMIRVAIIGISLRKRALKHDEGWGGGVGVLSNYAAEGVFRKLYDKKLHIWPPERYFI